jgi:hypothetical protein
MTHSDRCRCRDLSTVSRQGGCDRREFLKVAAAIPTALAATQAATQLAAAESDAATGELPQFHIGKRSFSRLIVGSNPFNAGSHLSVFVNREMRSYYTVEQVFKTLRRCEAAGINTWQVSARNVEQYRRYVDAGGRLQVLMVDDKDPASLKALAQKGCLGVAHHGETTDRLFKEGALDKVNEYLKQVRDAGMLVGVSTHMPAVVDAIESKGWDLDYYMTCVYERHRSEAELKALLGHVPLPVREVYLKSDPPRMFRAMQQTRRPCLAFKILAAGRLSENRQWVEQAFQGTFAAIKSNDGVIIGIYDRYSDQASEDAAFARRFGSGRLSSSS